MNKELRNMVQSMRATPGKVLVWVDMQQKSDARVALGATGVELIVNSAFGSDGIVKNPSLCRAARAHKGIEEGELLLVHHNTFDMVSRGEQDDEGNWGHPYKLGDTGVREGEGRECTWLFSIDESMVQLRLNNEGDVAGVMEGWVLVDRCKSERTIKAGLQVERPYLQNIWRRVDDGKLLITYKHSGNEVKWTFGGRQRSAWKLKDVDVLGYAGEKLLKEVRV